jgi:N-acetylmuramoyl-L-alanine amidase CwlA
MEIKKNLVNESKYDIKCPYEMNAEFIVVHNTANDASAQNEIAYMISNDNKVSYHYAVDDKEIVQGIPENRNAWHASDGRNGEGNRKGLAIEICYSKSGGDRFIQAEKNAAEFIANILKEKGWGIDKVKKHQDFTNKYCPHRTLDMGWDRFLNMIKSHIEEKPVANKKSNEEIAEEVIKGKWGNGIDREVRLTNAGYNYKEIQTIVNNKLNGKENKPSVEYYPIPNYKGSSIVDALNSIGVDSSFEHRKKIAQKNNVRDYTGTAQQNNQLLAKLKAGKLIKG